MNRYFIYLGYNGKKFCGWQIQPNGMTVQQCIEEALTTLLRQPISIVGAGRTDAGVHARLMVAHFDWHEPITDLPFLSEKLNLPFLFKISAGINAFPISCNNAA